MRGVGGTSLTTLRVKNDHTKVGKWSKNSKICPHSYWMTPNLGPHEVLRQRLLPLFFSYISGTMSGIFKFCPKIETLFSSYTLNIGEQESELRMSAFDSICVANKHCQVLHDKKLSWAERKFYRLRNSTHVNCWIGTDLLLKLFRHVV